MVITSPASGGSQPSDHLYINGLHQCWGGASPQPAMLLLSMQGSRLDPCHLLAATQALSHGQGESHKRSPLLLSSNRNRAKWPCQLVSLHHLITPRPTSDQRPRQAWRLGWETQPRPTPLSASTHLPPCGKENIPVGFLKVFPWSNRSKFPHPLIIVHSSRA